MQNEAVKFISGGMKSSPISACEIDSIIEPLSFRREASVVEMAERFRRNDIDNPNRKIIDKWTPSETIKQESILKVEKKAPREASHAYQQRVQCLFQQRPASK